MNNSSVKKQQLVNELEETRKRITELEVLEAKHKQAEETLQESKEIQRFVFDSIGEGIIIIDSVGNIVEVNEVALHLMGYSYKEEVIGRNSIEFVAERDRTRAMEDVRLKCLF